MNEPKSLICCLVVVAARQIDVKRLAKLKGKNLGPVVRIWKQLVVHLLLRPWDKGMSEKAN